MPRPRKYQDAATKQMAYRIRKEKEHLALQAAIFDLAHAVRQARGQDPVPIELDHIRTSDQTELIRQVAQAIKGGIAARAVNPVQ